MTGFWNGSTWHARLVSILRLSKIHPSWLTAVVGGYKASQNFQGNSHLSNGSVAANSLGQSPINFCDPPVLHTCSPWGQESYNLSGSASVRQQSSPTAASNYHPNWCFECPNPREIKTCDGFKRHMREHETHFQCMPQGSVVRTENGPKCAFCDEPNPDKRHLTTHNLELCTKAPRKYKRKDLLIKHLKTHNTADSSKLADQWQVTVNKKYFACGFCGSGFGSLTEQLNHIDTIHYRCSNHIDRWDSDKVIRGLLSQPVVNDHWRAALAADPRIQASHISWSPTRAKQLQYRLEMIQEPADILCKAAIYESNYGTREHGYLRSGSATGLTSRELGTSLSYRTNGLLPLPAASEIDPTTYAPRMTAPILQSQGLTYERAGLNAVNYGTDHGDCPSPRIISEVCRSPVRTICHHADHRAQPYFSPDRGESTMQQQNEAYVPWIRAATDTAVALEGQPEGSFSSRIDAMSRRVSSDVVPNWRSAQVTEWPNYPAHARPDYVQPISRTQAAQSSFSSIRPASPLDQFSIAYGPVHYPISAPQSSPSVDYRGIDLNGNLDNMQRFASDQDHTRGQIRSR